MKNYWNNKNVFSVNTIDRYASGFPLSMDNTYKTKKLSGQWKFKFCEKVSDVPKDFGTDNFDYSDFGTIKVPSEWQIEGFDTPIYTNIFYPHSIKVANLGFNPGIKPSKNSVGLYVCEFNMAEIRENYFIHFGGVNSCAEVYLNGEFVGYSEDTFDFQEYNVTTLLRTGKNVLSVIVYRYCTGSYLEDQDMWRLSGIFRDVYLINKPVKEIKDLYVTSVFKNEEYTIADVHVNALLSETNEGMTLTTEIFDKENILLETIITPVKDTSVVFEKTMEKIRAWSNENPYLYRIDFTLLDNGIFCDKRSIHFGFREIKIVPMKEGKGPFILLNGKPIKFRGVNRHEFHPEYGHAVPSELIYKDLLICKENNISAIRTSHYPNNRIFYELCDKLGILVMCENNLETHGLSMFIPGNSKLWTRHCIYRIKNMVNTYKNHACIVSWSLGNESGYGTSFMEMKNAALAIDKTRFIHYEEDVSGKVSDVFSEMYAPLEKMDALGQNKKVKHCQTTVFRPFGVTYKPEIYTDLPYMQCEYAHCMGNSLGNFKDYWEKFKQYDRLAGGFIWDFADQAIKVVREDGTIEYRFGGDFGDKPNDGVFAFNGILRADRTPNPALYEVRKEYQMIDFSFGQGKITLLNNFNFTDLNGYILQYTFLSNGIEYDSYSETIPSVLPGERYSASVNIPEKEGEITFVAEVISPYENRSIAYDQFIINKALLTLPVLHGGMSIDETNPWQIRIYNDEIQYILDKETGGIVSIKKGNSEILRNPLLPNFVRATIDNERLASVNIGFVKNLLGVYKFHTAQKKLSPKKDIKVDAQNGIVTVSIKWKFKYGKVSTDYVFGNEGVDISMNVTPSCELMRYGFSFGLRKEAKDISFYGKGPFENYCDRKSAAILKKYSGKAEDFNHEYLSPQENGNHTETRYLILGDKENGITVKAIDDPFEFGVLPYSMEKIENAQHAHELIKDDHYTITIDGKQRGVGGDTPAMLVLKPQYKILPKEEHKVKFRLTTN